jgi:hypothetical protein
VVKHTPSYIFSSQALLREFQIVKELHHPNIVEFYESFEGERQTERKRHRDRARDRETDRERERERRQRALELFPHFLS